MTSNLKAGTDIADGWHAVCYALGADHDFKKEVMNMANVNSAKPCAHRDKKCSLYR